MSVNEGNSMSTLEETQYDHNKRRYLISRDGLLDTTEKVEVWYSTSLIHQASSYAEKRQDHIEEYRDAHRDDFPRRYDSSIRDL